MFIGHAEKQHSNNLSDLCVFYCSVEFNSVCVVLPGYSDSTREAGGYGAGRAHTNPGDQNGVSASDKHPAVSTYSYSQTQGFSSGSSRAALSSSCPVNHNSTAPETCTLTVSADFTPLL